VRRLSRLLAGTVALAVSMALVLVAYAVLAGAGNESEGSPSRSQEEWADNRKVSGLSASITPTSITEPVLFEDIDLLLSPAPDPPKIGREEAIQMASRNRPGGALHSEPRALHGLATRTLEPYPDGPESIHNAPVWMVIWDMADGIIIGPVTDQPVQTIPSRVYVLVDADTGEPLAEFQRSIQLRPPQLWS